MHRPPPSQYQLTPELLLRAYAAGIFPMAESRGDGAIFWVDPQVRGVLPLDTFHVPRRLRKTVRAGIFEVGCNIDFESVVRACAETGAGRRDTWINDEIIRAYVELHHMGYAYSVECRHDGRLVGGLYGVALGGAFCGESMFSRAPNASKVALVHLVARLRRGGFRLLDTQFVTDHLKQFGAVEIPAREYLRRLEDALKAKAVFQFDLGVGVLESELDSLFRQSRTQTS